MYLAGRDLTDTERCSSFTTTAERDSLRDVKEKLCCIALNLDSGIKAVAESSVKEETYGLPDGNIITVGGKRCLYLGLLMRVPGGSFPAHHGRQEGQRNQGTTFQSITKYKVLICKYVYADAAPSGSTTMRPASVNTTEELTALAPSK